MKYLKDVKMVFSISFQCQTKIRLEDFKFRACFKQAVPKHSGNYRVWIHSETHTDMIRKYSQMHHKDKYSQVRTQLSHLAGLAKWLSVRLRSKRLSVRVQLQCNVTLILGSILCFKLNLELQLIWYKFNVQSMRISNID